MVSITLPEELVHRLEAISQKEKHPLADVVAAMAEKYQPEETPEQATDWSLILGIGEEEVTNMSTTFNETLKKYYQEKYGNPD